MIIIQGQNDIFSWRSPYRRYGPHVPCDTWCFSSPNRRSCSERWPSEERGLRPWIIWRMWLLPTIRRSIAIWSSRTGWRLHRSRGCHARDWGIPCRYPGWHSDGTWFRTRIWVESCWALSYNHHTLDHRFLMVLDISGLQGQPAKVIRPQHLLLYLYHEALKNCGSFEPFRVDVELPPVLGDEERVAESRLVYFIPV